MRSFEERTTTFRLEKNIHSPKERSCATNAPINVPIPLHLDPALMSARTVILSHQHAAIVAAPFLDNVRAPRRVMRERLQRRVRRRVGHVEKQRGGRGTDDTASAGASGACSRIGTAISGTSHLGCSLCRRLLRAPVLANARLRLGRDGLGRVAPIDKVVRRAVLKVAAPVGGEHRYRVLVELLGPRIEVVHEAADVRLEAAADRRRAVLRVAEMPLADLCLRILRRDREWR